VGQAERRYAMTFRMMPRLEAVWAKVLIVGAVSTSLALALSACGSSPATPSPTPAAVPLSSPTPAAVPLSSLAGLWKGTISSGQDISFQITDSKIIDLSLAYDISGAKCSIKVQTTLGFAEPLTGTTFAKTSVGTSGKTIVLSGKFESAASVSGDLSISGTDTICGKFADVKVTWKATK
jgi:hypothetical protein